MLEELLGSDVGNMKARLLYHCLCCAELPTYSDHRSGVVQKQVGQSISAVVLVDNYGYSVLQPIMSVEGEESGTKIYM